MNIKGIDVAKWNTITDYTKVKNSDVKFAIIKIINKQNNPEASFEKHWSGFTKAGIPIQGVYNYSYATTLEKFKADARKVISVLNGRKAMVWLDIEDAVLKNLGKLLADGIVEYSKVIKATGLEFGVYTGLSFYNSLLKPYASQLNFPFWIARYPKSNQMLLSDIPFSAMKPNIGKPIWGWQYSSKGKIDGIVGNVDLNEYYVDLNEHYTEESTNKSNPYAMPMGTVRKGNKGESVKWIQWYLVEKGYDIGKFGIDGDFGNATYNAVIKFQQDSGLVVDGLVGVKTIAALKR